MHLVMYIDTNSLSSSKTGYPFSFKLLGCAFSGERPINLMFKFAVLIFGRTAKAFERQ